MENTPADDIAEETFHHSSRHDFLNAMMEAALEGGREINRHFSLRQHHEAAGADEVKDGTLTTSEYTDALTAADRASDSAIRGILDEYDPAVRYVSEESEAQERAKEGGVRFLVDPLDGTSNFTKGSFDYSVTVAYQSFEEGKWKTRAGVVHDPVTNRIYFADERHSFTALCDPVGNTLLQGSISALQVHKETEAEPFAGGWQQRLKGKAIEVAVYKSGRGDAEVAQHAKDINRLGEAVRTDLAENGQLKRSYSTALVLSTMTYLQRPDGVILGGDSLNAWDVDAALHIVKQAGGFVTDPPVTIAGEPFVFVAKSASTLRALQHMVEAKAKTGEREHQPFQ